MMRIRVDGQAQCVHNPLGVMNAILPANVREYFLFDGEKIDEFAKPESAAQVKRAIYLVLKLEIIERGRRHLETAAAEYRKELKQVSTGALRDLLEKDERLRAERAKADRDLKERRVEIASARRKIAEIDERLRALQESRALQLQRDQLEAELATREHELGDVIEQLRDQVAGGYVMVAAEEMARGLEVVDEKRARGEIPSGMREQFLDDLIERGVCICGRGFAEGSPEHKCLLKMREGTMPGSLQDDVLHTGAALRVLQEGIGALEASLRKMTTRRGELVDLIATLRAKLDDVTRQLKGLPLEEVTQLEKKRQDYRTDIDLLTMEVGRLVERIDSLTKEIDALEKEIAKARKDAKREVLLGTKLQLAQQAADTLGIIHGAYADDMRKRIEARTKEIFKRLVWKESHFQDITLSSDFDLEVIDRWGMRARPELSAGERQVLSLSFIAAMSGISEEEAPLVMDTPFGRLSSQPRASIAKYLPDLAHQLVLFVTDEELHGEARSNLEPRIGAEYRLEFDSTTSCTRILEVVS